jgi:hypothetical protein
VIDKLHADIHKYQIVLTGSRALQIYGMLSHREVNDVDLAFTSIENLRTFSTNAGYSIKEDVEIQSPRYDEDYFKLYLNDVPIADCFIKPALVIEINGGYRLEYFRDIWAAKLKIILDRLSQNINDEVYNKHLSDFYNFFPNKDKPKK